MYGVLHQNLLHDQHIHFLSQIIDFLTKYCFRQVFQKDSNFAATTQYSIESDNWIQERYAIYEKDYPTVAFHNHRDFQVFEWVAQGYLNLLRNVLKVVTLFQTIGLIDFCEFSLSLVRQYVVGSALAFFEDLFTVMEVHVASKPCYHRVILFIRDSNHWHSLLPVSFSDAS